MAKILPVVLQPHPSLSARAEPVASVNAKTLETLENMLATMQRADGIGLAAPQIDVRQRLVVLDFGDIDNEGNRGKKIQPTKFMINPEILWKSSETATRLEGCLSLPGLWAEVERPAKIRYAYTDRDGARVEEEASGLLSACVQHEVDHLDGVVFIQRMSKLRQDMMRKKWQRLHDDILQYGAPFDTLDARKGVIPAGYVPERR